MENFRKTNLRSHYRSVRESLSSEYVSSSSAAACSLLGSWAELRTAGTVLTYLAFQNEIDLSCLFDVMPSIKWVVPRLDGNGMSLHVYEETHLVRHRFGMLEPDTSLPKVRPSDVDIVFVPGVVFDRHGVRIGFGGGYYDQFLPKTHALRVGITYDDCLVNRLPFEQHDQQVDWIITQSQILDCQKAT